MSRRAFAIIALLAATAVAGCTTTAEAGKDYTIKTERWSRAPRDKFYRIVKVPKAPVATGCEAGKSAPEDCPQK